MLSNSQLFISREAKKPKSSIILWKPKTLKKKSRVTDKVQVSEELPGVD